MAKITQKMIDDRKENNLDKDGTCKLSDAENFGDCLSGADIKYLVGTSLDVDNTRYVRPILYEAYRQGHLSDTQMKNAGYDPEDIPNPPDPDKVKKSKGGDNIKKSVISVDDAFETIQAEINEALDDKYGQKTDWGVSRDCYIAYTTPDFVVISTFDNDMFQIPYTRNDNGKGDIDVTLSDPVPADLQLITKALNESKWMVKSIKPTNRGDKLKDKEENIPEDLDKTFVEKVKGLTDESKTYFKTLLGVKDETIEKTVEPTSPTTGGTEMEKDVMTKETVQKMIKEETGELTKTVTDLKEENTSLKKRLDKSDEKVMKKTNKELLTKSVNLHKKLKKDMTPEEESDLVKEIKTDLEKEHGSELVERDIKTMTKALEEIPAHDLPFTGSKIQKELSDKYAQKAAEGRAAIEKMGTK